MTMADKKTAFATAGTVLVGVLVIVALSKSSKSIDEAAPNAEILTALVGYNSQELNSVCIPASSKTNLNIVEIIRDALKGDVPGVLAKEPTSPHEECKIKFCEVAKNNPGASTKGDTLALRICSDEAPANQEAPRS